MDTKHVRAHRLFEKQKKISWLKSAHRYQTSDANSGNNDRVLLCSISFSLIDLCTPEYTALRHERAKIMACEQDIQRDFSFTRICQTKQASAFTRRIDFLATYKKNALLLMHSLQMGDKLKEKHI